MFGSTFGWLFCVERHALIGKMLTKMQIHNVNS